MSLARRASAEKFKFPTLAMIRLSLGIFTFGKVFDENEIPCFYGVLLIVCLLLLLISDQICVLSDELSYIVYLRTVSRLCANLYPVQIMTDFYGLIRFYS